MRAGPDADEFVTTFVRNGRTLWLIAAAWVGRTDAQDLVQEAARIGWQRRERLAAGGDVAAWLAQIVRHAGANWRRKLRPAATDPCELPHPPARDERDDCVGALDLPDDLARALAALPGPARESLLLHAVGGLTFAEIGTLLGVPENTAASHARRARLALRAAVPAAAASAARSPQPTAPEMP